MRPYLLPDHTNFVLLEKQHNWLGVVKLKILTAEGLVGVISLEEEAVEPYSL